VRQKAENKKQRTTLTVDVVVEGVNLITRIKPSGWCGTLQLWRLKSILFTCIWSIPVLFYLIFLSTSSRKNAQVIVSFTVTIAVLTIFFQGPEES
jgi:hypothetical protein